MRSQPILMTRHAMREPRPLLLLVLLGAVPPPCRTRRSDRSRTRTEAKVDERNARACGPALQAHRRSLGGEKEQRARR